MPTTNSSTLHARAATAENSQDFTEMLKLAGEIVRIAPNDFFARILVARALARLGHESESASVYGAVSTALLKNGFDMTAIEACNEALKSCPGEFELYHSLGEVYDTIGGKKPGIKARSLPPPPTVEVETDGNGSLLRFTDDTLVVERAQALAVQPLRTPSQTRPDTGLPFFSGLSRDAFVNLVSEIERRTYFPGDILFDEGAPGDSLFVLLSGAVDVSRKGESLATLSAGSVFGELALITGQPRSANVSAIKKCSVFVVHVDDVQRVASAHPEITENIVEFARRRMLMNVVSSSAFFRPLSEADRLDVLSDFSTKLVPEGQILMEEGDHPTGLYVVANGTLEVTKSDKENESRFIAELHEGDVLGEIALVRDMEITARITAKTKSVVLFLDRATFAEIIARHSSLKEFLDGLSEQRFEETDELMSLETQELCESELVMV